MIWFAACSRKFSIAKRSRRSSYLATLAILSGARFVYLAFLVLSHIVCSFLMIPQKALWPDSIRFDLSARCITRNMDKTSSTHDTTTGGWQPWQYRSSARNFQIPRQKKIPREAARFPALSTRYRFEFSLFFIPMRVWRCFVLFYPEVVGSAGYLVLMGLTAEIQ